MKTNCPKCNQEYDVSFDRIGEKIKCDKCKAFFIIENPDFIDCPICGKSIAKGSILCVHCRYVLQPSQFTGNKVTDQHIKDDLPKNKSYGNIVIFTIVTIIITAIIIILFILLKDILAF